MDTCNILDNALLKLKPCVETEKANQKENFSALVIGDGCTDEFIYGKCERLAPEGPVPIFIPVNRVVNGGMARNVDRNFHSFGIKTCLITNEQEILKTRYVDEHTNHTIIRVDRGDKVVSMSFIDLVLVESLIQDYNAVVVSDYNKGFLTTESIKQIGKRCSECGIVSFIDTKKPIQDEWISDYSFIKINYVERQSVNDVSKETLNKMIVTLGKNGAEYQGERYPVEEVEVKDLSGAGDTFLAALVCNYLKSRNVSDAIRFANKMSSIVVQKRGVSTV